MVVIAPRAEVVNQWADDFQRVTGRFMSKVTGRDGEIHRLGVALLAFIAARELLICRLQPVSPSEPRS